jgi:hypothetical protein
MDSKFDYQSEIDTNKTSKSSNTSNSLHINFLVKDIALKALLFGMVFYILNSKLMNKILSCLDAYPWIERNLVQAMIFGVVFYLISVNL